MDVCKLTCKISYMGRQITYTTSADCKAEVNKETILKRFIRDHKVSDKNKPLVKLISYELGNQIGL